MNSIRCLSQIRITLIILIASFFFAGCAKQSGQKEFVARVNDSYLTKEDLARIIDTNSVSNFYRNEVIRNWINRELLYQQAVKQGISKEEKYKQLVAESQKELAGSLLLQKYYEDEKNNYEPSEIEDFYNKHKDDFKRFYDSYFINVITFNNEDKAIKFRSIALESNWDKAVNAFKNDSSIIGEQEYRLLYSYQVHPAALYKVISDMEPGEISTIINLAPGSYAVTKLNQVYGQGSVPPLDVIKQDVVDEFTAQKKDELLSNYLKELYSNNRIEVRN